MNYLDELNESQRHAVECTEGPQLAGAGSGKTRVLTYKIAYLLQQGVSPSNILALTFTNKAAREMKERIGKLVGEQYSRYLWMGTFHSIFSKILRQEAERLGYSHDYTIYDSTDSKSLLKQIVKEMGLDEKVYKPGIVSSRISMAKNNLLTPTDYASNRSIQQEDKMMRLYRLSDIFFTYNKRLKQANAMDFDDLLQNMHTLLTQFSDAREKYQQTFQYILVDEYQDTNYCQAQIVLQLAHPQNNICVVGDDAQSIYSFRGANIDNILRFSDMFAGARLFKLERNYRSTQNIVGAANSLIKRNRGQIPKDVYSEKEDGELIQIVALENDRNEGEYIAKRIEEGSHRYKHGQRNGDAGEYDSYAVLYRTNAQSRVIEDEFRKRQIPYRIYGSVSFYQRKEIKDALGYLRLIVNQQDDEALLRVINQPSRGIGDTTIRRVLDTAHRADTTAFAVVSDPSRYSLSVSAATQKRLTSFAAMIVRLREMSAEENVYDFTKRVLAETGVLTSALMERTQEGQDRYENLQELLNSMREFVELRIQQRERALTSDFLEEVSLLTDQDEHLDDETARVSLMTVHAAKGLEFPVVFIAGMEEKLFPSIFAETERDMEEERRLFYVAVTRAERCCIVTYAKQRWRNGSVTFSTPSQFLKDIDERYLDRSGEQQTKTNNSWTMPWMEREFRQEVRQSDSRPIDRHTETVSPKRLQKTTGWKVKGESELIETPYPIGSRVRHNTFGTGTVIKAMRENDNEKIVIRFDNSGEKTLLLKFARLERI